MDKGISHVLSMSILLYGLQRPIFNSQDKEPYSFVGLKAQEKTGLLLMPTAKVTKNVSAAEGGGNVLCSILISIKTKAWLYSFLRLLVGIHLSNVTKSNYLDIQKEAQFQRFARLSSHNTC